MDYQEIISTPVLRRSYKAFCINCGFVTTSINIERVVVCDSCIPFEIQKRSSMIISNFYCKYLHKKRNKYLL